MTPKTTTKITTQIRMMALCSSRTRCPMEVTGLGKLSPYSANAVLEANHRLRPSTPRDILSANCFRCVMDMLLSKNYKNGQTVSWGGSIHASLAQSHLFGNHVAELILIHPT